MMNFKFLLRSFLASCLFFVAAGFLASKVSAAPRLYFDPASLTTTQNTTFQVNLLIDTQNTSVFGADAIISLPAGDLSVKSVTNGGFFGDFSFAQTSGQIEIHGFFSTLYQSKSGAGTFATITLSSSKNTGSGTVGFVCSGSGNDTQILNSNGQNVLLCGSLNQLSLTYGTPASSPTPSSNGPTNACGGTCGSHYNCDSGLFCFKGFCRNPNCGTQTNCICPTTPPATKPPSKKIANPSPTIVTLVAATPYPTQQATESVSTKTPDPVQNQKKVDIKSLAIWLGLGIVGLIIIMIVIKLLKKGNPPKITPPTGNVEGVQTYHVEPPFSSPPEDPPFPQNIPPTV